MAQDQMSGGRKSDRQYSNRYVEFLYQWETTQRRMKRAVAGPPEGYQHPNSIDGRRVLRLGKGVPPRDKQESEFRVHRRRLVPNKSFEGHPDLLRPSTAPAGSLDLCLDETRTRRLLVRSGRHNVSSLQGGGVIITVEPEVKKPVRGRGNYNPGQGLSQEMIETLSFNPEQPSQQPTQNSVWSMTQLPSSPASTLQHRMSDPWSEAAPKLVTERPSTPTLHSCSAEERRSAFLGSLNAYAYNKVAGDCGRLRTSTGLRALAGCAH